MPDFGKIQIILGINDLFRDNKILAVENLRLQNLLLKLTKSVVIPFCHSWVKKTRLV